MSMGFIQRPQPSRQKRIDPADRLPGEKDLGSEIEDLFKDPQAWMQKPHEMLGGRTPEQCIANNDEQAIWDLIRNIKFVGST